MTSLHWQTSLQTQICHALTQLHNWSMSATLMYWRWLCYFASLRRPYTHYYQFIFYPVHAKFAIFYFARFNGNNLGIVTSWINYNVTAFDIGRLVINMLSPLMRDPLAGHTSLTDCEPYTWSADCCEFRHSKCERRDENSEKDRLLGT